MEIEFTRARAPRFGEVGESTRREVVYGDYLIPLGKERIR
jgi:hypothetical protein